MYLAFNKPRGVLTAMSDDRGRKTIVDFLGDRAERLFHVGRLDYDTEGLMLLTNDGELAHRLAHPSYEVAKTYWAEVPGPVPRDLGRRLQAGVELDDGVAVADKFRVLEQSGGRAMVEITLHEGRKHIVRRMLAEVGHPVSRLLRTTVGPIKLGSLRPGATRDLTTQGDRRAVRRRRPVGQAQAKAAQPQARDRMHGAPRSAVALRLRSEPFHLTGKGTRPPQATRRMKRFIVKELDSDSPGYSRRDPGRRRRQGRHP